MRKRIIFFSGILIFNLFVFSQNKFEYDYARFYSYEDLVGYFELYFSFYQPSLKTIVVEELEMTQGRLDVIIKNNLSGDVEVAKNWQFDFPVDENNKNLTGLLRFKLDFGNYNITIKANDINNPGFEEEHTFDIALISQSTNGLSISDIQLASAIKQDSQDKESIFYKNTLEITPNPSLIYGDNNPVIFFYSEIYGLDKTKYDNFIVEQKLYDHNNTVQYEKSRVLEDPFSSIVEIGAIRVNNLNSGIYTLLVSVKDNKNHISANSTKKIYVYNRSLVDETTTFTENSISELQSEIMILSEDELNYMFETAEYIATENEKSQWGKLKEIDAKKRFLVNFWDKRDYDFSTSINEYKRDYYERVNYANQHFGNVSRNEGWKTDRGRVYITYGKPSQIERFQNEYYTKPYEVWEYNDIEGGVIFFFVDEQGLNIYRLIHSNKKGEISNYREYQRYVQ